MTAHEVTKKVLIFGDGGFSDELIWVIKDIVDRRLDDISVVGKVVPRRLSSNAGESASIFEEEEISHWPLLKEYYFVVAIGDNKVRQKVVSFALSLGLKPLTLIHPSAVVSQSVSIAEGTVVMPQATLSPNSKISSFVIISTSATVGHDSSVGAYANVCPGVRLGGFTIIEEGCFVGSNAVTNPGSRMEAWSSLGASSFLLKKAAAGRTYIGVPARSLV